MKNDLTCEVVQDLLPSYVDHLTSDVTNTAIETHIRECADCRRILSDMQTPEPVPAETATDASTIDFLKKNNKRNKRRILAAILIVTLLLGSIWGYRTYFYPAPLKNTALIDYAVTVKDNKTIQIKGSLTDQTLGVAGIDYSCDPDHPETVTINVRTNRISAAGHNTFSDKKTETYAVKKVYVNDQIAWEDGTSILPKAAQIYATIHPYIGNMSANEKTLAALGISNVFSIANFKLQTTETPYGWTIYLDDAFTKKQQTTVEKTMKNYAMVILACTKNLGSVTFSYTLDGKTTDFTYTKEQGENEFLGTCNYFRSSATEFQTLLAKTGILSDPVFSRLSGNQGYRLTEQLNNVPDAEITGTIQNEKQNIIKQYESYLPTNSWSPGSISKSFSSEKDALAYIGYKNLRSFALPQKADSISVNATTYTRVDNAFRQFLSIIQNDPSAARMIGNEENFDLVKTLLRLITQTESLESLKKSLMELQDDNLQHLTTTLNIEKLQRVATLMADNLDNNSEEFWQTTAFKQNQWVLAQIFACPCTIFSDKAYVGGKGVDNSGGNLCDFIYQNRLSQNVALIEIKTPCTEIIGNSYRGTYSFSHELSGAVNQVLNYRDNLTKSYYTICHQSASQFEVLSPKCVVIIGKLASMNSTQIAAFESFRNSLSGVQILTFDELYQRVIDLIAILSETPSPTQHTPELEDEGDEFPF